MEVVLLAKFGLKLEWLPQQQPSVWAVVFSYCRLVISKAIIIKPIFQYNVCLPRLTHEHDSGHSWLVFHMCIFLTLDGGL